MAGTLPAGVPSGRNGTRPAPRPESSRPPLPRCHTETLPELLKRLRESPSDPDLLLAVARACLETGQSGDAFLYLRAAENSASHRGEVRRLMGLAHLKAGDVEQAVDDLMAAVRAYPGDTELRRALDEALERFTTPISLPDLGAREQPTQAAAHPPKEAGPRSRERRPPSKPVLLRGRRSSRLRQAANRRAVRLAVLVFALLVTGALALTLGVPTYIEGGGERVLRTIPIGRTEPAETSPSQRVADEASGEVARSPGWATPEAGGAPQRAEPSTAPAPSPETRAPTPVTTPETGELAPAPTPSEPTASLPKLAAGEAAGQALARAPAAQALQGEFAGEPKVAGEPAAPPSRAAEADGSLAEPALGRAGQAPRPAPAAPVLTGAAERGSEQPQADRTQEATDSRLEAPDLAVKATDSDPEAPDPAVKASDSDPETPDPVVKAFDSDPEAPDPVLEAMRGLPRLGRMDSPPNLQTNLRIPYTAELARQGARGRAIFWVLVSGSGRVEEVRVVRSSGSAELDAAAADAIRGSSYTPARRDGKPLPAWTQQQVMGLCCRSVPTR